MLNLFVVVMVVIYSKVFLLLHFIHIIITTIIIVYSYEVSSCTTSYWKEENILYLSKPTHIHGRLQKYAIWSYCGFVVTFYFKLSCTHDG